MVRQPQPSEEELEFVYSQIARGLSDAEVKDDMAEKEFPLRTDARYFRQRRREFNAARRVLEAGVEQERDPLLVEKRRDHIAFLTEALGRLGLPFLHLGQLPKYWHWENNEPLRYPEEHLKTDTRLPDAVEVRCLKAHLSLEAPLWAQRQALGEIIHQFRMLSTDLYRYFVDQARALSVPLRQEWSTPEPLLTTEFVECLFERAGSCALSEATPAVAPAYRRESIGEPSALWRLHWEGRFIALGSQELLEDLQTQHWRLLTEVEKLPMISRLREVRRNYEGLAKTFSGGLELMRLQRTFVGQCEVCRGWGGPEPEPPPTSRTSPLRGQE